MIPETRIAIIGIIVHGGDSIGKINDILHIYSEFIIGRMGIPYRERKVNVISVVMDAPEATIGAAAGKLGALPDVSVKTLYSR